MKGLSLSEILRGIPYELARAFRFLGTVVGVKSPEARLTLSTLRGSRRLEIVSRASSVDRAIEKNNYLARYAKFVTSQDGEDGVLAEIFARLGIVKGWCVEFGAWDGKFHSNVWDLVHNKQWKAVYIEPQSEAFKQLEKICLGLPDIHCFNQLVEIEGPDSLESILARTPIPTDFDLLVVDIDGNDFFIWQALERYRPKVVMIEFNSLIPPDIRFAVLNGDGVKASASLAAICHLGKAKGYELVCVIGGNVVLVLKEYFPKFEIEDNRPEAVFRPRLDIRLFQGYDGTLMLAGDTKFVWRHQFDRSGKIDHVFVGDNDIQVLPAGLRVFRPRLSYRNEFLEQQAKSDAAADQPANRLYAFRKNVTSECGEDGILQRLFELIGPRQKYCVDVGAYDGRTFSSTWSLLNEHGWSGVLIEKDEEAFRALSQRYASNRRVRVVQAEARTASHDSLDAILGRESCPRSFDFLCIDVEGNDYNLWAALKRFRPRVVMVDFNPTVANDVIFAQQDDPAVNHGASLHALVRLGHLKGYELAAVTSWNAIFVEKKLFARLGMGANDVASMYSPVLETRIFQSIDSYLSLVGCRRLIRHDHAIDEDRFQPLSPDLRALPYVEGKLDEIRSTFFHRRTHPDSSS